MEISEEINMESTAEFPIIVKKEPQICGKVVKINDSIEIPIDHFDYHESKLLLFLIKRDYRNSFPIIRWINSQVLLYSNTDDNKESQVTNLYLRIPNTEINKLLKKFKESEITDGYICDYYVFTDKTRKYPACIFYIKNVPDRLFLLTIESKKELKCHIDKFVCTSRNQIYGSPLTNHLYTCELNSTESLLYQHIELDGWIEHGTKKFSEI